MRNKKEEMDTSMDGSDFLFLLVLAAIAFTFLNAWFHNVKLMPWW